ncbi:MarR family transcriptional regulator [soil metagenome]
MANDPVVSRLRLATLRLAQRMRQESGNDADLTPSRYAVLSQVVASRVVANKAARMGDLARAEHVSKSTITRIVSRLAEQGFVEMVPDPDDGRSTLVAPTPAGLQVSKATSAQIDAFLADRLDGLTELERSAIEVAVLAMERLARLDR